MDRDVYQPRPGRRPLLPPVRSVALVAVGGAMGTVLRHGVGGRFPVTAGEFPVATFGENVLGAALLGLVLALLASHHPLSRRLRLLLATGALGAFTTFSAFATELSLLVDGGRAGMALAYAGGTLAVGVVAVAGGVRVGGRLAVRVLGPSGASQVPAPQDAPKR